MSWLVLSLWLIFAHFSLRTCFTFVLFRCFFLRYFYLFVFYAFCCLRHPRSAGVGGEDAGVFRQGGHGRRGPGPEET